MTKVSRSNPGNKKQKGPLFPAAPSVWSVLRPRYYNYYLLLIETSVL